MSATISADALGNLQDYIDRLPGVARQAARLAINDVATRSGLKALTSAIYDQIAFPAGYLNTDRIGVTKRATDDDLEAIIGARQRPTSLARFLTPGQSLATSRVGGVSVSVKSGDVRIMKNAFLVRLRSGAALTETQNNLGLAIRLKPGETLKNRKSGDAVQIFPNVYLLYAPSVDQVFRSIADEVAPDIAEDVGTEFVRQFTRLSDLQDA